MRLAWETEIQLGARALERFLALDLTPVSPPTLPQQTNKLPMQLVSPTTLPRDTLIQFISRALVSFGACDATAAVELLTALTHVSDVTVHVFVFSFHFYTIFPFAFLSIIIFFQVFPFIASTRPKCS